MKEWIMDTNELILYVKKGSKAAGENIRCKFKLRFVNLRSKKTDE